MASPVTVPNLPHAVGDNVPAAEWNDVGNDVNFLILPPAGRIYQNSGVSVPSQGSPFTTVSMQLTDYATGGMIASSGLVVPVAGKYLITGCTKWASSTPSSSTESVMQCVASLTGTLGGAGVAYGAGVFGVTMNYSDVRVLQANDVLNLQVAQVNGGASGMATSGDAFTYLAALWVSN